MMPMQKSIRDTAPYDTEESLGLAYLNWPISVSLSYMIQTTLYFKTDLSLFSVTFNQTSKVHWQSLKCQIKIIFIY